MLLLNVSKWCLVTKLNDKKTQTKTRREKSKKKNHWLVGTNLECGVSLPLPMRYISTVHHDEGPPSPACWSGAAGKRGVSE